MAAIVPSITLRHDLDGEEDLLLPVHLLSVRKIYAADLFFFFNSQIASYSHA